MKLFSKLLSRLGFDRREYIQWETSLAEIERKAALRKALFAEYREQFHLWQRAKRNKKKHLHIKSRLEAINAELGTLLTPEI